MSFIGHIFPAIRPLDQKSRTPLAMGLLAAAFVVASVEFQRHLGSESTGLYFAIVLLIGLTGLGVLMRQRWVVDNLEWLIDFIIFAQLVGGLALTMSAHTDAGFELLREMLFWAPVVCAWWAIYHCGRPWHILLRAGLLYAGLFAGGALDTPGRFEQEYLILGGLSIALMTMTIGLLVNNPGIYFTGPAAFDAVTHDPATGIASRASFESELELVAALCERQRQPFSLILVGTGIDSAKPDDATARSIAWAIVDGVRKGDSVCRWNDASFAVLLPNTRLESGQVLARRVEAALNALRSPDGAPVAIRIAVREHSPGEDPMFTLTAVEEDLSVDARNAPRPVPGDSA